jgi:hypothetical protein
MSQLLAEGTKRPTSASKSSGEKGLRKNAA